MSIVSQSETFQYGAHTVTLVTGNMARQASGAVTVIMGETVVLVTVVGVPPTDEPRDFFPLSVHYQERTYAAGKVPGGFFKREGRPSVDEVLISRLMDRPLRPLFPDGFYGEVQVVASVLSLDPNVPSDIPAIIGASCALTLSGIPFNGPIGAARVGYIDGQFKLNPDLDTLATSQLDLVVAGTENAVLMVESSAQELPEKTMLEAVTYGHQQMQTAIKAIQVLAGKAAKPRWDWQAPQPDQELQQRVQSECAEPLRKAYEIKEKAQRYAAIDAIKQSLLSSVQAGTESAPTEKAVLGIFSAIEKDIVRGNILLNKPRIDGRDLQTVRPIDINVKVLPRTHGSAVFTRGETQALVVTTLGTGKDAQIIDALSGERKEHFMLHYNFPPYSVGEVGMVGAPKRREIGHGALAKRALSAVVPDEESFPYVLRVVSEITESNGSSSMATVCGSSLSLMDAGVPIKAPVAGVAMGLIKDRDQYAVLTDILGDEDHLGDMDFKVAGTQQGVTALQMDIKIEGITTEIMEKALAQAKDGRMHILGEMNKVLSLPRQDISDYAPRIVTFKVHPDKIRDIIGKGGVTIRSITEETGVSIDIDDDGTVKIASSDQNASREARQRIEKIIEEAKIGKIYEGTVVRIVDFGAFVSILPGKEGLVHISQIANQRVERVTDYLKEGQIIPVKVIEIDRQGRIRLSMKEAQDEQQGQPVQ